MAATQPGAAVPATTPPTLEMKLEVVVLPVADVDRAKAFYAALGWHEDIDLTTDEGLRVVEFTPPGSATSIIFGDGITTARPGAVQDLQLSVADVEAAREHLLAAGVAQVSEVFHDRGGVFHHGGEEGRVPGLAPDRASYGSFVAFADPDGNGWIVQEITARIPGRVPAELPR